ncbi:chymotrypsinogen B-like isoform X2 [Paramacrobiotus metropolitanus]|uniref:chymotrypsinogen B-like isoform X2 n=1 Tax=Paramacrobiotus metropolitanus TaxID=2943436 RepID=UPI0024462B62|nr:chymotrypsinogen B-like isoform X2 [Paramacrobiotus metropolitanus]
MASCGFPMILLAVIKILCVLLALSEAAITCGIPQISPRSDMSRVKGGNDAVPGSWPWQVRLGIRQANGQVMWNCGGSILTEKYVVTAAHCLVGGVNAQYMIRAGDHDQTRTEVAQVDRAVLRIGQHPNYAGQSGNFRNDIAILRLATNLTFKAQISPVCLPISKEDIPHGTTCMVTGWGKSGPTGTSYKPALQQGRVQIIGRQQCAAQYWGNMVTSNVQVCAGTPAGTVDACSGDSGGPLVCQDPTSRRWVLHGVVSFGPLTGCGNPTKPAVYTRITGLLDWIKTTTGNTVLQY